MDNIKRIANLCDDEYQGLFGVQKATFEAMLAVLEEASRQLRKKGGPIPILSVLDKLVITLGYYREYRSMLHIGFDYGVYKSRIFYAIHWVEDTLLKSKLFSLPSKRELINPDTDVEVVIIDVTEQETERPKKNKRNLIQESANATPSKSN